MSQSGKKVKIQCTLLNTLGPLRKWNKSVHSFYTSCRPGSVRLLGMKTCNIVGTLHFSLANGIFLGSHKYIHGIADWGDTTNDNDVTSIKWFLY